MLNTGGDRDEDIIEGRGDDGLDVEEDFQDDEADEEKPDLAGLLFRAAALSDDEVADAEGRRVGRGRRRRSDPLRFSGWRGDDAPRGLLERERRALVRLPLDDDVVGACVWLGYRVDGVEWRIYPHHAIAASRRPQ